MVTGFVCLTPGCSRTPARGSWICARCWRWVPTETRLALDGHHDAMKWNTSWLANDLAAFRDFVRWSAEQTCRLAAVQAWEAFPQARTDVWTLNEVVLIKNELGL